ncbi:hypothetical protein [Bradyrhizobium roseum]|uniref:hypothetical protein n=1 Tax=Bradyrhizobium roseum TaxID=3056648 RepID=UPI0026393A67|nr:hypothetical protein [Bradyrhizobium roseus]WKA26355.1 hypothetical protein QUH67_22460 [Bradyrhizobium roseus]
MSESALRQQRKFEDFQAEYEGSIPFTRSNVFNYLSDLLIYIPTRSQIDSDKGSRSGRLLAPLDALYLCVLLGPVVVMTAVRHRLGR